jgi:hypothetical protein
VATAAQRDGPSIDEDVDAVLVAIAHRAAHQQRTIAVRRDDDLVIRELC